jgi:hypothetical protein
MVGRQLHRDTDRAVVGRDFLDQAKRDDIARITRILYGLQGVFDGFFIEHWKNTFAQAERKRKSTSRLCPKSAERGLSQTAAASNFRRSSRPTSAAS